MGAMPSNMNFKPMPGAPGVDPMQAAGAGMDATRLMRPGVNLTLPNGGQDATMAAVLNAGAPPGSVSATPGMSPNGGGAFAPMMTPQGQPGPNVPWQVQNGMGGNGGGPPPMSARGPMAAVPSAMNHEYATDTGTQSTVGLDGGLAGRGTQQVGRSNYNLDRIAEREYRQNQDPSLMMKMFETRAYTGGYGGRHGYGQTQGVQPMRQPGQVPPPMMTPGNDAAMNEGGDEGGVMDSPAALRVPTAGGFMSQPSPVTTRPPLMQAPGYGGSSDMAAPGMQPQPGQMPFNFPVPAAMPTNGAGVLPPSPLEGGSGVPQRPGFTPAQPQSPQDIAAHIQQMKAAGVSATYGKDGFKYEPLPTVKPELPQISEEKGAERLNPQTGMKETAPSRHYYFVPGPDGEPVKKYVGEGQSAAGAAANPAGVAAPATPVKTSTGNSFQANPNPAAPVAAVQTGQMPRESYANDLTPEASLSAARAEYLKSGSDAALRQHFVNFPSEATRHLDEAKAALDEHGQLMHQESVRLAAAQAAAVHRDAYLKRQGATAATVGVHAGDWERFYPAQAKALKNNQNAPMLKAQLLERFNKAVDASHAASMKTVKEAREYQGVRE